MESSLTNTGALFFIGAFMLIIVSYQFQSAELTNQNVLDARNHTLVETTRLLLRQELAKIGQEANPTSSLIVADDDQIMYKADVDSDGVVDTVSFYLKKFRQSPFENEDIKKFVRKVNNSEEEFAYRGITNIKFFYFDENGIPTNSNSKIRFVGFKLTLQSSERYNDKYQTITIEERLLPKNLWM